MTTPLEQIAGRKQVLNEEVVINVYRCTSRENLRHHRLPCRADVGVLSRDMVSTVVQRK